MYWLSLCPKDQLGTGLATGTIGVDTNPDRMNDVTQGGFLIVYSQMDSAGGEQLKAFTALGRIADTPEEQVEGPWTVNRRIAYFSAFDVPLASVRDDLVFPAQRPAWQSEGLVPIEEADFLVIAEAMLPPPIFQKVQSVAEDRIL